MTTNTIHAYVAERITYDQTGDADVRPARVVAESPDLRVVAGAVRAARDEQARLGGRLDGIVWDWNILRRDGPRDAPVTRGLNAAECRVVSEISAAGGAAKTQPAHSYEVRCNGLLSLSTSSWTAAAERLDALATAAGPVNLEIDGEDVNGATVEQLRRETLSQDGYREPTDAEMTAALNWSR
jgi:hypothetical protein